MLKKYLEYNGDLGSQNGGLGSGEVIQRAR